ncbi:MAG TPA: hypothetical protein VK973_06770 [Arenicellales bacterium]|nr:hypothetical protein [Arenicellales bacterium]
MPDQSARRRSVVCFSLIAAAAALLAGCAYGPHAYEADKVTLCHKGKKTLILPESAVSAHLGHGDTYGPCE